MHLHIAEPKTTQQFLARLTAVERIKIRRASEAGLESMLYTDFPSDMITAEQLKEAAAILHKEYAEFTQNPNWWAGSTRNH